MKEIIQAIILGIVQGLGEFLPISSSGHLVLMHALGLKITESNFAFDTALHLGTLFSLLIYFKKAIFSFIRRFVYKIGLLFNKRKGRFVWFIKAKEFEIFLLIVLATIPGALAGYYFDDLIEKYANSLWLVGSALIFYGILLYLADNFYKKHEKMILQEETKLKLKNKRGINQIPLWKGLLIGISQALALIPGTSRSGVTITTGLFLKLKREEVARFSFILSIPIILGASLVKIRFLFTDDYDVAPVLLSFIVAFSFGYLAIKYLLRYVSTKDYKIFAYYRIILGLIILYLGLRF